MAVRIRMKQMGRRHRPFYRICAMDIRAPRDGRILEELGTYDPMVPLTDARWTHLSVGIAGTGVRAGVIGEEEFLALLKKHQIAYNPHYLWE